MGKPKIIGYKTNHELTYSTPNLPEMTYDSDGISIPWQYIGKDGMPFEAPRYLTNRELDQLMHECGMKPVYAERPFHARPAFGGYRVYCKRCKTTTHIGVDRLPHDTANAHRCLYNPEEVTDAAS
jgi:hypothetical protein